jgi:hypothetical protein
MKLITHKNGSKTTYRFVPDDYDETQETKKDTVSSDMTTSLRRSMSYSDISKEDWNRIFGNDQPKT